MAGVWQSAARKTQPAHCIAGQASKCWELSADSNIMDKWNRGVWSAYCCASARVRLELEMPSLKALLGILVTGLALSGCMQATTYQAAPEANLKPADKVQLAKARYVNTPVAEPYRRAIVDYHRQANSRARSSSIPTITISISCRPAARPSATASRWVRKRWPSPASRKRRQHGRMAEMDSYRRHPQAHRRPAGYVPGGVDNPLGARALYLLPGHIVTPCSGSTAPTSRNISAPRFPRAASA